MRITSKAGAAFNGSSSIASVNSTGYAPPQVRSTFSRQLSPSQHNQAIDMREGLVRAFVEQLPYGPLDSWKSPIVGIMEGEAASGHQALTPGPSIEPRVDVVMHRVDEHKRRVRHGVCGCGLSRCHPDIADIGATSTTMGNYAAVSDATYYEQTAGLHPTNPVGQALLAPFFQAAVHSLIPVVP